MTSSKVIKEENIMFVLIMMASGMIQSLITENIMFVLIGMSKNGAWQYSVAVAWLFRNLYVLTKNKIYSTVRCFS